MTKADERRDVLAAFADWILERAKQLGGQGGETPAKVAPGNAGQVAATAPANPVPPVGPTVPLPYFGTGGPVPGMNPMPWAVDPIGRPVQPSPVPTQAVAPSPAPGPFYHIFTCPLCQAPKEWKINRARWPNAVCADCFRGSRGTR